MIAPTKFLSESSQRFKRNLTILPITISNRSHKVQHGKSQFASGRSPFFYTVSLFDRIFQQVTDRNIRSRLESIIFHQPQADIASKIQVFPPPASL